MQKRQEIRQQAESAIFEHILHELQTSFDKQVTLPRIDSTGILIKPHKPTEDDLHVPAAV